MLLKIIILFILLLLVLLILTCLIGLLCSDGSKRKKNDSSRSRES